MSEVQQQRASTSFSPVLFFLAGAIVQLLGFALELPGMWASIVQLAGFGLMAVFIVKSLRGRKHGARAR